MLEERTLMSPIEMRIKETELPQRGLVVVTAKWADLTLLRPFETFAKGDSSWLPTYEYPSSPVIYFFATEAAALHAHEQNGVSAHRCNAR